MRVGAILPASILLLLASPALGAFLQCPPNIMSMCRSRCNPCGRSIMPTCPTSNDCEERCECRGDTPPPPYPNPNPPPYPGPRPVSPKPVKGKKKGHKRDDEEMARNFVA